MKLVFVPLKDVFKECKGKRQFSIKKDAYRRFSSVSNEMQIGIKKIAALYIAQTWQQPEHYDLYIPAITWHARFAYDKEKTDRYNERPWGGGFGLSRWDEKGNWHGLYAMAFKDSWNKWEPIAGYGWESTWRPLADENFHLGLGFTAGVTARDNWNYIPLPVLLPLASVGYGPVTFQMTYIPGTYNNGNVYFAWMRFQF